ncbi:uncharacterized protein BDW47DRAFT_97910 [Aspergillus candidus]|uniref:Uncharacterized protein n=1 Tax=Aspergillus candidus TaxID=41067 RepID=A0A2I2FNB1_ASPCN|nr:hypothetical protein BDW47DRAFT_97910 [Aspergillus candidus]PLB42121.1 hypothetical protein BDW47DRAFT_97910 [Aspergillus candidus]
MILVFAATRVSGFIYLFIFIYRFPLRGTPPGTLGGRNLRLSTVWLATCGCSRGFHILRDRG